MIVECKIYIFEFIFLKEKEEIFFFLIFYMIYLSIYISDIFILIFF